MKQLIIGMFCLLFAGCTQNNGYIGDIFGQWQLKEIISDDETAIIDGTLFISFQGEVVLVRAMAADGHRSGDYVGTFIHKDGNLSLNLSHGSADIMDKFQIENKTQPSFKVDFLDKKHMTLSDNGKTWIYHKF